MTDSIPTPVGPLRVDDNATYTAWGDFLPRLVRVTALSPEAGGRDVFDGILPDGTTVWGYASQVTSITPRETIC